MRDPYQVLGVAKTASADDIKAAYRRLAKQYHPDLNPGRPDIELKFKEVNAAHSLLSDADKRARFDRGEIDANGNERPDRHFRRAYGGAENRNQRQGASTGGASRKSGLFDEEGDDPFADFFGSAKRRYGAGAAGGGSGTKIKGSDVNYSVSIPFIDACLGAKRRLELTSGRTIDIAIPLGARDQSKLRLKGQGLPGLGGGAAGDALVEVHVEPHPFFVRKGEDIHLELPISLAEAILGAVVKVPTLDGQVALKIPKGSNSGATLRLKGKGVPGSDSERGDQYVKLVVMLPEKPDADLTSFIEGWSKNRGYDVRRRFNEGTT
jgi:DnaJ-class molecular chaperone